MSDFDRLPRLNFAKLFSLREYGPKGLTNFICKKIKLHTLDYIISECRELRGKHLWNFPGPSKLFSIKSGREGKLGSSSQQWNHAL